MNTNKKTARIADLSQRKAARVAGVLYLIVIVAGVSAEFFCAPEAYCARRCHSNSQ